jgi:hypothetical protein
MSHGQYEGIIPVLAWKDWEQRQKILRQDSQSPGRESNQALS